MSAYKSSNIARIGPGIHVPTQSSPFLFLFIIIILIRCIGDIGNQCGWKILLDSLKKCFIAMGNGARRRAAFVTD